MMMIALYKKKRETKRKSQERVKKKFGERKHKIDSMII